jgi:hypothetical protein
MPDFRSELLRQLERACEMEIVGPHLPETTEELATEEKLRRMFHIGADALGESK